MKVVVSEFIDEAALERFGPEVELTYDPGLVDDREALFAALSRAEDRHGLYSDPAVIRTAGEWDAVLRERGLKISGHRLSAAPN